jgi:diguanylate cyclase (GGDEF)-like protein/PAS domain S-box-containing protein
VDRIKHFLAGIGLALTGVVALEGLLKVGLHPFSPIGWPGLGMIGGAALGGWPGLAGGLVVLAGCYIANLGDATRYPEFYSSGANALGWLVALLGMALSIMYLRRRLAELRRRAVRHAESESELRSRLAHERTLRLTQEQLQMVMDAAPALIAFVGSDLRIKLHNKAYEELFHLPSERIAGRHVSEVIGADAFAQTEPFAERAVAGEAVEFERTQPLPDGRTLHLAARFVPHRTEEGAVDGFVGVLVDITERKAMEQKIAALALADPLTGLQNRRGLDEHLGRAILLALRRKSPLSLLYIDLDGFKPVNDLHGHGAGDAVLVEVAARLKAAVRASDIVGRVGGDEFVVALIDTPENHAVEKARALIETIERPVNIHASFARVSASVGIAVFPAHGKTVVEIERNADTAMYAAKRAGRGRVVVYSQNFERRLAE